MIPKLIEFIEQNIELIEDNRFEEVYDQLYVSEAEFSYGELTKILLSIDLDPLKYMRFVPRYYLEYEKSDWSFERFVVPANVVQLEGSAFSSCCPIDELILPESIKQIETAVFTDARISKITYLGTKEQFNHVLISYRDSYRGLKIHCSDGEYMIY